MIRLPRWLSRRRKPSPLEEQYREFFVEQKHGPVLQVVRLNPGESVSFAVAEFQAEQQRLAIQRRMTADLLSDLDPGLVPTSQILADHLRVVVAA
ncbi:MAG: hypothetical protein ACO1ON_13075 [Nocardioides sp.]